jgi:hypothetical protein
MKRHVGLFVTALGNRGLGFCNQLLSGPSQHFLIGSERGFCYELVLHDSFTIPEQPRPKQFRLLLSRTERPGTKSVELHVVVHHRTPGVNLRQTIESMTLLEGIRSQSGISPSSLTHRFD